MATNTKRTPAPSDSLAAVVRPAALPADSNAEAHAALDDLFTALKPFGACESPRIVALFNRIKQAI